MNEKTREPKPMVRIEKHDIEIFILDEGDSMAMNSSTNYDHHFSGPSLVMKTSSPSRGQSVHEYYVNDFDAWEYMDYMMKLGEKYLEENPEFDVNKFRKDNRKKRSEYKPHVSWHKKKKS